MYIIPFPVSSWHFNTVYNMEHGRDPLSRTVAVLCHLQLCLQGSMLAASNESAVTGGKSKTRNMLFLSLPLFLFSSSPPPDSFLPDLLFFFSSPFRSHLFPSTSSVWLADASIQEYTMLKLACLTCTERMHWVGP